MVKDLSEGKLRRRKLIGAAIKDFFGGEKIPQDMFENMWKAIDRNKIAELDTLERISAKAIMGNLADVEYASHLL